MNQLVRPVSLLPPVSAVATPMTAAAIGALATQCLVVEVDTWPKPGLVSHVDNGSHGDMDAALLRRSAAVLEPFFGRLAAAGARGATMDILRAIGIDAEAAMVAETRGVNTHRGAIFGLGLLCAAAGRRHIIGARDGATLGDIVRERWAEAILHGPVPLDSHGATAERRHGAAGARGESAAGFPTVYGLGLPAWRAATRLAPSDPEAVRVQTIFAIMAVLEDTNLLHRGGTGGLAFAREAAADFLAKGGIGADDWHDRAASVHASFVARNLSPGGAADLLAMTLFVAALDDPP